MTMRAGLFGSCIKVDTNGTLEHLLGLKLMAPKTDFAVMSVLG